MHAHACTSLKYQTTAQTCALRMIDLMGGRENSRVQSFWPMTNSREQDNLP